MAADAAASSNERLKVFVSYSRTDLDFADQLVLALEDKGFEALVDRHDIDAAEKWKDRLGALISSCDTVVFVLSERSAGSPICRWEVEEAARLGKRIVPVVPHDPVGVPPPPELAELNYIHFFKHPNVPGSGFYDGVQKLDRALRVNLGWLRRQTAYAEQAAAWLADKSDDRVLGGKPLEEALTWRASAPPGANVSPLVLEYLAAGESVAARRKAEADANIAQREAALKRARTATMFGFGLATVLLIAVAIGGVSVAKMMSGLGLQRSQALAALARQASDARDFERAARYALAGMHGARALVGGFRPDDAEVELARAWASHRANFVFPAVGGRVVDAALSGDGKIVAVWDTERNLQIRDVDTGADIISERVDYSAPYGVWGMFSPNTRYFALSIGAQPGSAVSTIVYDLVSRRRLTTIDGGTVAFNPQSTEVVAVFEENGADMIRPWQRPGLGAIWRLDGSPAPRIVLAGSGRPSGYSPDGATIVGSDEGRVALWSANDGVQVATFGARLARADGAYARFSPDGQRIVIYSNAEPARIYDATTHTLLGALRGISDNARSSTGDYRDAADPQSASDWRARQRRSTCSVKYSENANVMAAADCRWGLALRDVASGEITRSIDLFYGVADRAQFSDDLSRAMLVYGGTVRVFPDLFEVDESGFVRIQAAASVQDADLSPDARRAIAFLADGSAELWDVAENRRIANVPAAERVLGDLFTADSQFLVLREGGEGTVRVRDASDGHVVSTLEHAGEAVTQAHLSGDALVTVTNTCVARRWDVASRRARILWRGGSDCSRAQIGRGGATALVFNRGRSIDIVDIGTGRTVQLVADGASYTCPRPEIPCESIRGDVVVLVGADTLVFDARTGERIVRLQARVGVISEDGRLGVETGGGQHVRLYDLRAGQVLHDLQGDVSPRVVSYQFHGDRLVQFGDDVRVGNVWDLRTGHAISDHFLFGPVLSDNPARTLAWREQTLIISDATRLLTLRGQDLLRTVCNGFFSYETDRRLTDRERREAPMVGADFNGDLCATRESWEFWRGPRR